MPFQAWIHPLRTIQRESYTDASMGPCPFRHGYVTNCAIYVGSYPMLQWGHALSGMDTLYVSAYDSQIACSLQWGHALSGMDTWSISQVRGTTLRVLQWGHALSGMDIHVVGGRFAWSIMLQWGHALSGMDMPSDVFTGKHGERLQWGHALSGMDIPVDRYEIDELIKASMGPCPFRHGYDQQSCCHECRY